MKRPFVYLASAVLVSLAGAALSRAGTIEARMVTARRQLLTLQYQAPASEYAEVERATSYAAALPWAASLRGAIRAQRAESHYWQGAYEALRLGRDAGGAIVEQDPTILLLAANAAYRQVKLDGTDRNAAERLTEIVRQYGEILKRDASLVDAAYNYEFAARTRDALVRARGARPGTRGTPSMSTAAATGHTMHGDSGLAPVNPSMNEFKVVVPQRPDERQQKPEAGSGGTKVRKG